MAMHAAKRRRDKAIAATSTVNQSNDSRASSFVQTSPLSHFQRAKHPQQRPTQRTGLHLSRKHTCTKVPQPSNIRPAYRHSPFSYVAASGVYIAIEDGTEVKQGEDSDSDEVIMCVDMRGRGTVGCCYYESCTGSLHLVEDVECGGLDAVDTCECPLTNYLCTD